MSPKKTVKKGIKKAVKKPVKCAAKKPLSVQKPFGKAAIVGAIADMTCVAKKDVGAVVCGLADVIEAHLKKRGPGEFTLPGIAKFRVICKPATKARQGVNPFTGEPMMFAAKPARNIVKIRALKKLKDMAK